MRDALTAEPWGDSRLGLVGRITSVEQIGVRALLAGGIVPVIASTASGLNVNADNAAAAVAGALGASELIFLSDVPGLMGPGGEVIRRVTRRLGRAAGGLREHHRGHDPQAGRGAGGARRRRLARPDRS